MKAYMNQDSNRGLNIKLAILKALTSEYTKGGVKILTALDLKPAHDN